MGSGPSRGGRESSAIADIITTSIRIHILRALVTIAVVVVFVAITIRRILTIRRIRTTRVATTISIIIVAIVIAIDRPID